MKPCYYCSAPSITTAHDVPVCKEHKPAEAPTEPRLTPATFWLDEEPYTMYPTDTKDWGICTVFKPLTKSQIIAQAKDMELLDPAYGLDIPDV